MPPRQCIIMILLILWEKKNWFSTNTDFFLRINIPALFPGNKIVGKWPFFFLQFSLKRGTWHMWSWMLTSWSLFITFMYTCSNVCDILKSWMKYIKKKNPIKDFKRLSWPRDSLFLFQQNAVRILCGNAKYIYCKNIIHYSDLTHCFISK